MSLYFFVGPRQERDIGLKNERRRGDVSDGPTELTSLAGAICSAPVDRHKKPVRRMLGSSALPPSLCSRDDPRLQLSPRGDKTLR